MVDLRNYSKGDLVTVVTESGEEFTGKFTGREKHESDYSKNYVEFQFEGEEIWEKVSDRVSNEVLSAHQTFMIGSDRPDDAILWGDLWNGSDYESIKIGIIESIEVE